MSGAKRYGQRIMIYEELLRETWVDLPEIVYFRWHINVSKKPIHYKKFLKLFESLTQKTIIEGYETIIFSYLVSQKYVTANTLIKAYKEALFYKRVSFEAIVALLDLASKEEIQNRIFTEIYSAYINYNGHNYDEFIMLKEHLARTHGCEISISAFRRNPLMVEVEFLGPEDMCEQARQKDWELISLS